MTVDRMCPECGSDPWQAKDYQRAVQGNLNLRSDYERQAAAHAVEKARLTLRIMDLEQELRGLRAKKERQGRVIRRLETRLRERGQRPYEGMTDPGAPIRPGENERIRAWVEGLYSHGQISKELYDNIMKEGQWPVEQGGS